MFHWFFSGTFDKVSDPCLFASDRTCLFLENHHCAKDEKNDLKCPQSMVLELFLES